MIGTGQPPADIQPRLAVWGLTAAVRTPVGLWSLPTINDCDAALWFGPSRDLPAADGSDVPAAPLLLLGEDDHDGRAWQVVPPHEAGSARLRRALESCFARTRSLRDGGVADPLRERYRDFLGHELRSPLTAIRTALEEIAAEPQDPLPLVRIALRNVRRLHRTLEWSQDVLALADMPHAVAIDALMILAANRPGAPAEPPAEPATVIPFAAAEPVG
jgi:signal transduction histidine kinase